MLFLVSAQREAVADRREALIREWFRGQAP
jgi:hypothetical protein